MNLPFGLTSEQVTLAFILALAGFFLYLQLKRFARLSSGDRNAPADSEQEPPENTQSDDTKEDPEE